MSRQTIWFLGIWLALFALVVIIAVQSREIDHLQARVDCLEHPHAESSVAGHFVGTGKKRHFVITQPAHRTGCK